MTTEDSPSAADPGTTGGMPPAPVSSRTETDSPPTPADPRAGVPSPVTEPAAATGSPNSPPAEASLREIFPYAAPLLAFLLLGSLEGMLPSADWYPLAYTAKVGIVAVVAWICRSTWRDLRPLPTPVTTILAVAAGILVFLLWVGLDGLYPTFPWLGQRASFDPSGLESPVRQAFLAVRLAGLVVLVPWIEELFWRSFLIRWLIKPNFLSVPVGKVTPTAAIVSSGAFALVHPEWLPAFLTGLLWAGLLGRSGSLAACVLSHAVANLALGLYVLTTGAWKYW